LDRVPGALAEIDELDPFPGAPDQQVRRYFQSADLPVERVFIAIQAIGKKTLDGITPVTTWRQGDIVYHQPAATSPPRGCIHSPWVSCVSCMHRILNEVPGAPQTGN
jgi:hypothetical protein